jgi:plastocyanin
MLYVPDALTVPVGSTVTFILVGGPDPDHPLGFDPPLNYSSSSSGKDTLLIFTFTKPVNFRFFCTIHGISGTIIVQ